MELKKIGVLTSGGDAPGMNAAIRSIVRYGLSQGFEMVGVERGYHGLLRGEFIELTAASVSDLIQRGGTILQTARSKAFATPEGIESAAKIAKDYGLDALIVIGGDGSFRGAQKLCEQGIPTIGIPGTIDNDISCTEYTIGYDTALNTAMEAVDKIRDTATSHQRCSLIEVMGRHAGYIAIEVALATGAEMVLVPEKDKNCPRVQLVNRIVEDIKAAQSVGKKHHIVIIAEGVGGSQELAEMIEECTEVETRATVLGHIQRGGSPTIKDRVVAAQMGMRAIDLLVEGKSNRVVIIKNGKISDVDIDEGLAMKKSICEKDYNLISHLSRSINNVGQN
ncbi:MAG: 6-phosphofructokinase [Clostridia bacterium]|nr:6-phosphofructokinase [Clostridia bacterium]